MEKLLFENYALSPEILRAVDDMNYTEMTAIQAGAIPAILEGADIIGRSSTGTGKTAAFGIPAIESIRDTDSKKPQVLILCPTRELAMQICGELRKYAKYKQGIKIVPVFGGDSMLNQIRQLKGANIVVGTPGRVMDHMRRATLRLDEIKMVVLDEADEMLNMGFYEDMQTILKEAPASRQTLLFSATMPASILKLTKEFQKDPQMIDINKGKRALDDIGQTYYSIPEDQKMAALNLLLQMIRPNRSLVFCNTKKMVDELVTYLNENGFRSFGLHGDMRQAARTQVMQDFKNGRIHILVATDVAARGIDVEDIDAVFNYDIPQEYEYYIHRIGRTARAGKKGFSYTLACNRYQIRRIKEIEQYIHAEIKEAKLPTAADITQRRREHWLELVKTALTEKDNSHWRPMLDGLLKEGYDSGDVACALLEMVAGRDKRAIPVVQGLVLNPARSTRSGGRVVLSLNIGRAKKITPNLIVTAIAAATGLPPRAVGKIDILSDRTLIEMSAADAKLVLQKMAHCTLKNIPATFTLSTAKAGDQAKNDRGRERKSVSGQQRKH